MSIDRRNRSEERSYGQAVLRNLRAVDTQDSVAVLLRHSARFKTEESWKALLTEVGHQSAHRFGGMLPGHSRLRISHSPVHRCAETAIDIFNGFRNKYPHADADIIGPEPLLAPLRYFTKDRSGMEAWKREVGGKPFLRAWIDGTIPAGLICPAGDAVERTIGHALSSLHDAPSRTIHILIGHDFGLILVREHLFGGRFEELPWIDFLDGILLVPNCDCTFTAAWQDYHIKSTM